MHAIYPIHRNAAERHSTTFDLVFVSTKDQYVYSETYYMEQTVSRVTFEQRPDERICPIFIQNAVCYVEARSERNIE